MKATSSYNWSTVDDICKALGVSRRTVYDRIELGHIPAVQPGRRAFFVSRAWLDAATAAPKRCVTDWPSIIEATKDIA